MAVGPFEPMDEIRRLAGVQCVLCFFVWQLLFIDVLFGERGRGSYFIQSTSESRNTVFAVELEGLPMDDNANGLSGHLVFLPVGGLGRLIGTLRRTPRGSSQSENENAPHAEALIPDYPNLRRSGYQGDSQRISRTPVLGWL